MALGVAIVVACAFQNPVSPEYPCGTQGLDCGHGLCCWRGDSCGGEIGCPVGYCCWDDTTSRSGKSMRPAVRP